jgi:hypothetical protein
MNRTKKRLLAGSVGKIIGRSRYPRRAVLVPTVDPIALLADQEEPPAFNLADSPENRRTVRLFFTAMPVAFRWPMPPAHRSVQTIMIRTPSMVRNLPASLNLQYLQRTN